MNIVTFPGFGIKLQIPQIAFKIFGFGIYMYGICILFGITISTILCKYNKIKFNIQYDHAMEIILNSFLIGILGARLYYIIFNLDYYKKFPYDIINIRDGGLAIYGGLIVGFIYVVFKCKKDNIKMFDLLDYIIPYVALSQSFGRWGNFFNVEAYGYETNSIFRMGIYTVKGYSEVHPVFFYESFCDLIIFIILLLLQNNRKFEGQIFYCYLLGYGFIRMILESFRADSLMLFNFRISQILSIIIFLYSLIILLKNKVKMNIKKNT